MRVVVVTPTYFPSKYWGGPTTAMHSLCNHLARLPGMELEVVTTDAASPVLSDRIETNAFPERLADYPVFYCRRRLLVSVSPGLLVTAWRRIRLADVVHLSATYSFPTLPVLVMARVHSKPLVWTPHGALIPWSGARKALLKSLWNRLCRVLIDARRTVIHVASARESESAKAVMGSVPVKVIPFGIDLPPYVARPLRGERPLRLLFLGRLDPIKGLENLFRALALEGARNATLSVCGTGDADYARSLEALAAQLAIAPRVRFRGHVDGAEKAAEFENADVLVLPSHTENFGLVVAEALAHGVPVIASRGTPWGEVEARGCGRWVENSPESLARAIESMDAADFARMGEKGRRWMQGTFSWPVIAAEVKATYEALRAASSVSFAAAPNRRAP